MFILYLFIPLLKFPFLSLELDLQSSVQKAISTLDPVNFLNGGKIPLSATDVVEPTARFLQFDKVRESERERTEAERQRQREKTKER